MSEMPNITRNNAHHWGFHMPNKEYSLQHLKNMMEGDKQYIYYAFLTYLQLNFSALNIQCTQITD